MKTDADVLHMDIQGQGDTVVLLHGWGMHSGIWAELVTTLAGHYRVVCIDLPGHGYSPAACPLTLSAVSEQILAQVTGACHWVGWSLGASVLMRLAAKAPAQVKSMILMAANPCFVAKDDWRHGIEANIFSTFAVDLQQNYEKTLRQFIALQTLGSDDGKASLKQLREQLFAAGEPDIDTLMQGLDILMHADLRAELQANECPSLVVLGERDQLVPVSVSAFYQTLSCRAQIETIKGAGHAPFLSHPQRTAERCLHFISTQAGKAVNG